MTQKYNRPKLWTWRKTVTTAGTPVKLHDDLEIPDGYAVVIKALQGNTGFIYVGESEDRVTSNGFELDAGESIGYRVTNANKIWIDSSVDSESICASVEIQ